MVLETAQMLSTAARRHEKDLGYKSAYPNHPMTLWVGDDLHYLYLILTKTTCYAPSYANVTLGNSSNLQRGGIFQDTSLAL